MSVAYRMLGSVADAADAVQDAYTRWYGLAEPARQQITSPTGWLVTTVSRVCLDVLGSARVRRERYVGPWLPEPVPGTAPWTSIGAGPPGDPADRVTFDESVTMALLVVLETMTPAERVAFVLHDAFRCSFAEIAEIVGRSPAACRQLAASARRRVRAERRTTVPAGEQARVVAAFRAAWQSGNLDALVAVLDPAATAITDGGGQVSAALTPVCGATDVGRLLIGVLARQPDVRLRPTVANRSPGLVACSAAGDVLAVICVGTRGELVERLWITRNPGKLRAWS